MSPPSEHPLPPLPPLQTHLPLVVLFHFDIAEPHHDLLLQLPNHTLLLAWRIIPPPDCWPLLSPADRAPARNFDHRPLYLTFEGPLTGNRGAVRRVLSTSATVLHTTPASLTVHILSLSELTLTLPL